MLSLFKYCSTITHAEKHILPKPISRETIIRELFLSPDVANAISKMEPEDLRDDLRQEMFVVLCEMDEAKLRGLYERKELKAFLAGTMWRMMASDRSTFYNTHRKYREQMLTNSVHVTKDGALAMFSQEDANPSGNWNYDFGLIEILPEGLVHRDLDEERVHWQDKVHDVLQQIDPYEADMFRVYTAMGGKSCHPVAQATGIPIRSVRLAVSQAREKLKTRLRNVE